MIKQNVTLGICLLAAFLVSLALGDIAWRTLSRDAGVAAEIIGAIRLPRALLAVLIGGGLGLSGAAMQSYLRNPLAEPGVLGISSGASLGAVLAFYAGLAHLFPLALPLSGILGAALVGSLLMIAAWKGGGSLHLLLAGVAISALCSALSALALNLTANPFARIEIVFWLMGSLTDRGPEHFWLMAPFAVIGMAMLFRLRRALDALTLGEDVAKSLGFPLAKLHLLLVAGVALAVGPGVAVAGSIGFVGLIVPHLVRLMAGGNVAPLPSRLLFPSFLAGGTVLLLADIAVRHIPTSGEELKLGVLTALIGAPLFFWLLIAKRGGRL